MVLDRKTAVAGLAIAVQIRIPYVHCCIIGPW